MAKSERYSIKASCPVCGKGMSPQGLVGHVRTHQRGTEVGEQGSRALAQAEEGKGFRVTTRLAEASFIDFVPKEFRTTSTMLQLAKVVTEREWGWPEMEIGDWLDTFLFHAMRQRGIILGGYQVLPKEKPS